MLSHVNVHASLGVSASRQKTPSQDSRNVVGLCTVVQDLRQLLERHWGAKDVKVLNLSVRVTLHGPDPSWLIPPGLRCRPLLALARSFHGVNIFVQQLESGLWICEHEGEQGLLMPH